MNDDLIKRSDAIKALHEEWDGGWLEATGEWVADNCEAVLNRLPSAGRPQGEWIEVEEDWRHQIEFWKCSECDFAVSSRYNFCPHCGARMKGADDE